MTEAGVPSRPRILLTVQAPERASDPELARRKNARYAEEIAAAGGEPLVIDETATADERAAAFTTMRGLLLTGGADVAPALYGADADGARDTEPGRDELEAAAFASARERQLPVLGICRGFQAINVFMGGRLLQHLDDHGSPAYLSGPANRHPLRLQPASRLARILRPTDPNDAVLSVNTYHHQAVRRADLAPGLLVAGTSRSAEGELVEAFEGANPATVLFGVQCHPERTDSTPAEFGRLWRFFVDASRHAARPEAAEREVRAAPPR